MFEQIKTKNQFVFLPVLFTSCRFSSRRSGICPGRRVRKNQLYSDRYDSHSGVTIIHSWLILRCPVIPYVNDRSEHFENIGKLANQHGCIKYIELMKYHPLGLSKAKQIGAETEYDNSKFLDKSTAEKFAKIIRMTTKKPVKVT